MYADNRYYREYQRMLVKLHALIAAGDGDSAEAIELRQEMDEPEARLSEEEAIRLNALSGDLSMLHDREIPDPEVVRRVPARELPQRIILAYQTRNWDELLELLRADVSVFLKPDQVAYMRSRAYEALDELAPAIAFMDEAARRAPDSANFRALAMELLWKDGRFSQAYARAKTYLVDARVPGRLHLASGGIVSRQAQRDQLPADIKTTSTLAIERLEAALPREALTAMAFAALGAIGLLSARVGDTAKAESALKRAIDVPTASDRQLAALGLLLDELELIRAGRLESAEERSLARQLADAVVPEHAQYALAA
jgi:tetratricopeptide (TPR) repeat protein